ncbi:hypothetical protein TRFO_04891 [Tritrichomonas foetus]|uniref:Initiator binding domain-containing protein n=1 Tax=Tritrichomonas foetus TaxID=1144522 RepID=A0A1J4KA30_9EUKA|nr:hypothetical protein TRFO_04891 [Tritrichomonas foetus]|eukprot:OHT08287.1 hypothetical protein TRFO_04891 [Tritrichomonas foetus]
MVEHLPSLEEIPEFEDDEKLYEFVCSTFQDYREKNDPPNSEFFNELIWLFSTLLERAQNVRSVAYKSGFIFLQEEVAVNVAKIGQTIGMTNAQVSQRIKQWTNVVWDLNQKKSVLYPFEENVDLRSWTLRQIQKNEMLKRYVNSQISLQTAQIIQQANTISPAMLRPVSQINPRIFDIGAIKTNDPVNVKPATWEFNTTPVKSLVLF